MTEPNHPLGTAKESINIASESDVWALLMSQRIVLDDILDAPDDMNLTADDLERGWRLKRDIEAKMGFGPVAPISPGGDFAPIIKAPQKQMDQTLAVPARLIVDNAELSRTASDFFRRRNHP